MVELADEKFMLIAAELLVDRAIEGLPIMREVTLNGLKPTSSCADEMMGGNPDPNLVGN